MGRPLVPLLLAAAQFALLAGCHTEPAAPPGAVVPVPLSASTDDWYRAARAAGTSVAPLDAARSRIVITVRRGGPLARLGHDHAIATGPITGAVAPQANRADFRFRLDQLIIDDAGVRAGAGLGPPPAPEAIEGTRQNMLTRVLDAARYPEVVLHAERAGSERCRLTITLHGVTRTLTVPVQLNEVDGVIRATGTLTLRQSDFGIVPMSVFGGALVVEDELALRFDLRTGQA